MNLTKIVPILTVAGGAVAAACGDGTGPAAAPQFSRQITFPEFGTRLTQGPARLEIELLPTGLVAREIEIKDPSELNDEEEIESRVTAITVAGDEGTLTLALGGLAVRFTAATEFEADDADLTFAEFVARVEAALAAGREPAMEAERLPPAEPQAPDDPSFVAREVKLDDDDEEEAELELNVDGDNVAECATLTDAPAGCTGAVRVLGLGVAIVEGVTELEAEAEDLQGEVEFEGLVQSVDAAAGSVTLEDGTVIRIVAGTELESESGDADQLGSLADVAAAVALGAVVEADGEGVVESTDPRTLVAIEIEFEVEDDEANGGG
ncbi:MAG: hypothetical protein ACREMJ_09600 [Gemmatimonadales bacterium]